jgi:hypothetical protein
MPEVAQFWPQDARGWEKLSRRPRGKGMRFDIVWDPAKIARIQKRLEDRDRQQVTSRGALVRDEMPALPNVFPQLSRILDGAAWREHLRPVVFLAVRSQKYGVQETNPVSCTPFIAPASLGRPKMSGSTYQGCGTLGEVDLTSDGVRRMITRS